MTEKKKTDEISSQISSENRQELFQKIKEVQSLPDEVVSDFLKSKGKLRLTDFKNKILPNVR